MTNCAAFRPGPSSVPFDARGSRQAAPRCAALHRAHASPGTTRDKSGRPGAPRRGHARLGRGRGAGRSEGLYAGLPGSSVIVSGLRSVTRVPPDRDKNFAPCFSGNVSHTVQETVAVSSSRGRASEITMTIRSSDWSGLKGCRRQWTKVPRGKEASVGGGPQ